MRPEEFFETDEQILVFLLVRLRPRDSDAMVDMRVAHLWTMRDGKTARCEIFTERETAVAAAGLPPATMPGT